jgi:hypothetical protein
MRDDPLGLRKRDFEDVKLKKDTLKKLNDLVTKHRGRVGVNDKNRIMYQLKEYMHHNELSVDEMKKKLEPFEYLGVKDDGSFFIPSQDEKKQ